MLRHFSRLSILISLCCSQNYIFTFPFYNHLNRTSELIGVVTIEVLQQGLSDDLQRRSIDDDSDVYVGYAGIHVESLASHMTAQGRTKHRV